MQPTSKADDVRQPRELTEAQYSRRFAWHVTDEIAKGVVHLIAPKVGISYKVLSAKSQGNKIKLGLSVNGEFTKQIFLASALEGKLQSSIGIISVSKLQGNAK